MFNLFTEILEEADVSDEPFPVRAAKQTYQACMDTGKSLDFLWLILLFMAIPTL